ncbi:hypothetical protein BRC63_03280, partial [Halobacteriales archaeon QH_10_70_21]
MGQTLTEKILDDHLVEGDLETGAEIGIEIDQVLTQDTTGTFVWLQFEALSTNPDEASTTGSNATEERSESWESRVPRA